MSSGALVTRSTFVILAVRSLAVIASSAVLLRTSYCLSTRATINTTINTTVIQVPVLTRGWYEPGSCCPAHHVWQDGTLYCSYGMPGPALIPSTVATQSASSTWAKPGCTRTALLCRIILSSVVYHITGSLPSLCLTANPVHFYESTSITHCVQPSKSGHPLVVAAFASTAHR